MNKRKKIKKQDRLTLFDLYNYTCNHCKCKFEKPQNYNGKNTIMANGLWLEIDHIIPLSKGGTDDFKNKQALCNVCNSKKSNKRI